MTYSKSYTKFIFLLISLCFFNCTILGQSYPIQNYNSIDYKAGNQNIDFAQNKNMNLFVANNLGVLSFNGNQWTTYSYKTGSKKRSLAFDDSNHRLYAGSQGDFGYYKDNWEYVSLANRLPSSTPNFDEVWDVYIHEGMIYFCTFQGIFIFQNDEFHKVITLHEGLERTFHVGGQLFLQNKYGKLFELKNNEVFKSIHQEQTNDVISGIVHYSDGYLLFYHSGYIEYATYETAEPALTFLQNKIKGTYVNHVFELSDTRIAISTQTSGLFLVDLLTQSIDRFTTENGLLSNTCLRSFQDYNGNLWVGLQNGLSMIEVNSPIRLIQRDIGIQGSGYEIFETDNYTYYSTSNGIYYQWQDNKATLIENTEGPAYSFKEVDGNIYACHHNGLYLLENDKANLISKINGLWNIKPLSNYSGYMIGGTYSGLVVFTNNNGLLQFEHAIKGFEESSRFFEEDHQGNIWVSQYYKGLYYLSLSEDLQSVENRSYSFQNGSIPMQMTISKMNNQIYVTSSEGIYLYDTERLQFIKDSFFESAIGNQPVYMLSQDAMKNIHVIAEEVVGYYKQISLQNYQFIPSSLAIMRYHFNNDLLHASINQKKGILFSGNEGFIEYKPERETNIRASLPIYISKIEDITQGEILYKKHPFGKPSDKKTLPIKPTTRTIKLYIESPNFNKHNEHVYRYYVKGFEKNYGEWTTEQTKEYTNLKEGKYQLFIQSKDNFGTITEAEHITLKVKPPLHRTLVAKILYIMLSVAFILFIYLSQKRKYKKKAKTIEATKQKELSAKDKKLEQIENIRQEERLKEQQRLQEVELQKQKELVQVKQESMQNELQHLNKLLAASTMNLVVKNEFIDSIKNELTDVKNKGKYPETKQRLENIVKNIDINLGLQEDWKEFEYHFNRVHGEFLTRLREQYTNLTPKDHKLCAFLRLNLSTKEIAQLMSISVRGVEIARYRLRKKLDLDTGDSLAQFILDY